MVIPVVSSSLTTISLNGYDILKNAMCSNSGSCAEGGPPKTAFK